MDREHVVVCCRVQATSAMIDCGRDVTVFKTYLSVFRCMPSAAQRLAGSSEVNWRSDLLCPFAARWWTRQQQHHKLQCRQYSVHEMHAGRRASKTPCCLQLEHVSSSFLYPQSLWSQEVAQRLCSGQHALLSCEQLHRLLTCIVAAIGSLYQVYCSCSFKHH